VERRESAKKGEGYLIMASLKKKKQERGAARVNGGGHQYGLKKKSRSKGDKLHPSFNQEKRKSRRGNSGRGTGWPFPSLRGGGGSLEGKGRHPNRFDIKGKGGGERHEKKKKKKQKGAKGSGET